MRSDLALLRQNEANAGVTSQHIELLQEQLEKARSEATSSTRERDSARQREDATADAARLLGEKLATAQADAAELREQLAAAEVREMF